MEKKVKKVSRDLGQYYFNNQDFEGNTEEFLIETAPLIGFIVHSFNSLDSLLNSEISELINDRTDQIGAIVLYKLPFSSKIALFNRLSASIQLWSECEIPYFKELVDNLNECGKLRNAVVHAEWEHVDDKGYTFVKMDYKRGALKQQYWQFTPESLEKIRNFIAETFDLF